MVASSVSLSVVAAVSFGAVVWDLVLGLVFCRLLWCLEEFVLSLLRVCFTTVNVLMAPSHTLGPSE